MICFTKICGAETSLILRLRHARPFVGLFVLLVGLTFFTSGARAQDLRCQELFASSTLGELAKLRQAINDVGAENSVLRARLTEDFEQKLTELLRQSPQDRARLLDELRENLKRMQSTESLSQREGNDRRQAERKSVLLPIVRLKKVLVTDIDPKQLPVQDASEIDKGDRFTKKGEQGVLWSHDERFVALRLQPVSASQAPDRTQIIDLKTQKTHHFESDAGFFARSGSIWVSQKNSQWQIFDLKQEKILATYSDQVSLLPQDVTDRYVIIDSGHTKTLRYFTGENYVLGRQYGFSEHSDVIAYIENGRIQLRRLSTGQDLGVDLGIKDAQITTVGPLKDFFKFAIPGGQVKYFFLDDLIVRDSPSRNMLNIVPGTHVTAVWWITPLNKDFTRFTNQDTGATMDVPGHHASEHQRLLVSQSQQSRWLEFDFVKWTERVIPGSYMRVQDQRYLSTSNADAGGWTLSYFDLKTQRAYEFSSASFVRPVPGTDLFRVWRDSEAQTWLTTLENVEDRSAALEHLLGVRPGASPRGTYFFTIENGKIAIVSTILELP